MRIVARHTCRRRMTIWARGRACPGARLNEKRGIGYRNVFHHTSRQRKGQQRRQHTPGYPSHTEHRFCISLQYTRLVIVWPRSTKPGEEPHFSGKQKHYTSLTDITAFVTYMYYVFAPQLLAEVRFTGYSHLNSPPVFFSYGRLTAH